MPGGVFPFRKEFSHCARAPCPGKAGQGILRLGARETRFSGNFPKKRENSRKAVATPFRRGYNGNHFRSFLR